MQACSRHLLCRGVKVGHQPITLFNCTAADRLLLRSMHPRFLIVGSGGSVVAVDRLKGRNLKPFRQQIRLRRTREATHICAA